MSRTATPKEIVNQLNKYIIGQEDAKKALAVALRNRYRRMRLPNELKEEIVPKNILMIGPTGVGKTELARRLAKLVHAPFVKVEATKFTEVGYVGRDVESMVRDLVDMSVRMIKEQKMIEVQEEARKQANRRLVKLLVPEKKKKSSASILSRCCLINSKTRNHKNKTKTIVKLQINGDGSNINWNSVS